MREAEAQTGYPGNTEWLARTAAASLPSDDQQEWLHLARMDLPAFVDQRHTIGEYPAPKADLGQLLAETMSATDLVFVAPVYWYSLPSSLKQMLDHWSAWMRIPGVPFKDNMHHKNLYLITTSGDRSKAQPMIDAVGLCADFLGMKRAGVLWGKGGPPHAVVDDVEAVKQARTLFRR